MNGAALLIVLLGAMFFDFPHFIAAYNYAHCQERVLTVHQDSRPEPLDVRYLEALPPSSLPVLIRTRRTGIVTSRASGKKLERTVQKLETFLGSWRLADALILRAAKAAAGMRAQE